MSLSIPVPVMLGSGLTRLYLEQLLRRPVELCSVCHAAGINETLPGSAMFQVSFSTAA